MIDIVERVSNQLIFDEMQQDALLAAHVLVNLFKQEDIPHSLIPIGGYAELENRRDQIFGTEDGKYPGNPDVGLDIIVHATTNADVNYVYAYTGPHAHLVIARISSSPILILSRRYAHLRHPSHRFTPTLQLGERVWRCRKRRSRSWFSERSFPRRTDWSWSG